MLKLRNGPEDVADAAHRAGVAESFPVWNTPLRGRHGWPPSAGIVLGQYETRVIDMASAYATIADSGVYHRPHFVQKVVNAQGEVLFRQERRGEPRRAAHREGRCRQRHRGHGAHCGLPNGHTLAGGRPSAAKTGTHQLGDTGANRDAWMVGFTPQLSTAVGSAQSRATYLWSTVGAARSTAQACPPTSGRPPWTVLCRTPTSSLSRLRREVGGYAGFRPRHHRCNRSRRRRPASPAASAAERH